MLEEYSKFSGEITRVFYNYNIPEAYDFILEVLEDTYVDIEISLPIYEEGPKFSKLNNLRGENGMPIGRSHEISCW